MRIRRLVLVVGAMLSCAGLVRAEQVSNPQFENWKKFNEGSSATVTTTIEAKGQKINTESTNKLTAKADDQVTVEMSGTVEVAGQKRPIPPQSQKVPAKVEKEDAPVQVGEATEKVEAAGKTFDCKVYEITKALGNGQTVKAKTWLNSEVPGGVVKMEAKSEQSSVVAILKSYEAK